MKHKFTYLLFFLLLISCLASARGEERSSTLDLLEVPLGTALEIERQTSMSVLSSAKENQQQKKTPVTANGTVADANGEPLVGVSILVKGTSNGTVTDLDGHFKILAAPGDILEVSYIGYVPQAVTVTDTQPMKIVLTEDSQMLNEVVVTALGIKRATKALQCSGSERK